MIKLISKLLILIFTITPLISCSDDNKANSNTSIVSDEFAPVSKEIENLQDEIILNIILKSSDNRSRVFAKSYLVKLKNLLTYLSTYPNDKDALYRAFEASRNLDQLPLPLADSARIEPILERYNAALARHAKSKSIDVSQFNWSIFSYDFNDGLGLFWTQATKGNWSTTDGNAVNPQTKATARASKFDANKAWLVSPQLDFTDILNPELQLRHSIQIGRGDEPLNTAAVLKQGYKILITDKFSYGDKLVFPDLKCPEGINPEVDMDTSSCTDNTIWEELEIQKPKGDDFHTITTQPVSLQRYAGKKAVFIAILLNLDNAGTKVIGKHFNNWSVYEFKLLGSGILPAPQSAPKSLLTYEFLNTDLSPLLTFNTDPNGNTWNHGTFRDFSYAAVSTQNGPNTAYTASLIYPNIDLTTEENALYLNVDQSVRPGLDTYDFWQRLKLKISTDYVSGNKPNTATWTELDIKTDDKIEYDRFNKLSKYGINISDYIGENISLNFEFNTESGDNHLWQVNKISITPLKTDLK